VIPIAMQFLFYASPVAYAVSAVPPSLRPLYTLNPTTGLLEAFRWSLLGQERVQLQPLLISVTAAVVLFLVGAFSFSRAEQQFADVI
jgi:lipopolysaccharide transport system permease protein